MSLEFVRTITGISKQKIGERQNASSVISWVERNQVQFTRLLLNFDRVVNSFNFQDINSIPASLTNAIGIKQQLEDITLPTFREMIVADKKETIKKFESTSTFINQMMQRGETTKEEPYLAFHISNIDPQSLVVGAVFHYYEELLIEKGIIDESLRDKFSYGFIEVLANQRNRNPLWDAIADSDKLNWVDGDDTFTEDFRRSVGLS